MTGALAGHRIVVTRAEEPGGPLAAALRRAGATAIVVPLIRIEPVAQVDRATWTTVADFDWLVFTSANGLRSFVERLDATERAAFRAHRRIASVGPATARAVAEAGGNSALIAPEFIAESLANALGDVSGRRILWPRAAGARDVLAQTLRSRGAVLVDRVIYKTVPLEVPDAFRNDVLTAHVVTFTSPSAVRAFVSAFGTDVRPRIVCIGPVTAFAAREAGLTVHALAGVFTLDGLVDAALEVVEAIAAAPVEEHASPIA
ncbi:MAG: uroporphyrinogen-III synthase [Gemmatimonadota bacterium]|nr:uroporphyrinogen-III synthase [Gemmatimonadota bacterium]